MAKQPVTQKNKDGISIDEASNILDRTIGFINNCDTKASIILGGALAIIAVVFSTEGLTKIYQIIKAITQPTIGKPTGSGVLYLLLLFGFSVVLIAGFILLVLTLVGRTKTKTQKERKCDKSIVYFGHISSNESAEKYRKTVLALSRDGLLTDILNQIYINSEICSKKFKLYNKGMRCSIIGLFALLLLLGIGVFYF